MNAQKRYDEALARIKRADAWFETATRDEQDKYADRYRELIIEIGAAAVELNNIGKGIK